MAQRDTLYGDSELEEPEMVRLVLLQGIKLITTGKVTGKEYIFSGGGAELDVDVRDADYLLSRTMTSCCTGLTAKYFEVVRQ